MVAPLPSRHRTSERPLAEFDGSIVFATGLGIRTWPDRRGEHPETADGSRVEASVVVVGSIAWDLASGVLGNPVADELQFAVLVRTAVEPAISATVAPSW